MARGFSGVKQVIKSANTRNRGRVEIMGGSDRCYFFECSTTVDQMSSQQTIITLNLSKLQLYILHV